MKISHLQEGSVAGDPGITQNAGDAPRFGRHPTVLEKEKTEKVDETTTSGVVASVPQSMGKTIKRAGIFSGIKTSSKYPNSRKAGIYEDEISEENLIAKQRQEELFKKAKLRDLGQRNKISDMLHKKHLEQIMMAEMEILDEEDNDFWYHGPDAVAKELHFTTNKPTISIDDVNELWSNRPPKHVSIINNKPFMDKPDVASILKAHKELSESGELI